MIKNRFQLINLAKTVQEKKVRRDLLDILEFTLQAADPYLLTLKALKEIDLSKYHRLFVIGAGKGTYRMALAAEEMLGNHLTAGWISVPKRIQDGRLRKIRVTLAGHPFPNAGSVKGARRILSLIKKAGRRDLVLALFSGGASALFSLPVKGVTSVEAQKITRLLLRSGAKIDEINAVRKHWSEVKGGRLAEKARDTNLIALYLSDVVGDDLSVVASGPTVPDQSTFANAIAVLKKYQLWAKVPLSIKEFLLEGKSGRVEETPKKKFAWVKNIIIGNHRTLIQAAKKKAHDLGYEIIVSTSQMQGRTETMGLKLLDELQKQGGKKPQLLIAAGETTFRVRAKNPGGRNQQMGLAILPKIKPNLTFLAFDTDGIDGVSDGGEPVGGILIDYQTLCAAKKLKLNVKKALWTNDSYHFFEKSGGQIKTGYVGTNLGDIVLISRTS